MPTFPKPCMGLSNQEAGMANLRRFQKDTTAYEVIIVDDEVKLALVVDTESGDCKPVEILKGMTTERLELAMWGFGWIETEVVMEECTLSMT